MEKSNESTVVSPAMSKRTSSDSISYKNCKRKSMSRRARLVLPVLKVYRDLRKARIANRIRKGAAVYCTAVLEYLVAEVCDLAGYMAKESKRKRITPRHLLFAIKRDTELNKLLKNVTIPEGGVNPMIHPELLPKKSLKKLNAMSKAEKDAEAVVEVEESAD